MSGHVYAQVQAQQKTLTGSSPGSRLLQRTCACGQHTIAGGECSACRTEQSMLLRAQRAFGPASAPIAGQGNALAQEPVPSLHAALDGASRFGHDFSRIPIHPLQTVVPQPKLAVNQPGDIHEQEADRVAEQVMRMTDPGPAVSHDEDGATTSLMRTQSGEPQAGTGAALSGVPRLVHTVLNSGAGQPLDPATRNFMEPRFGHDFSRVRIHSDARAAESAKAVNALAYTVGTNVVFGTGQYVPGTSAGKKVLAHELTHTIQQTGVGGTSGDARSSLQRTIGDGHDL